EQRGIVFRQIPTAGTRLAAGSTVQLTASNGPSTAVVPNAVGLTQTEGRERLVAAGFTVTESRLFNDAEPGLSVAQTPPAGRQQGREGQHGAHQRVAGQRYGRRAERRRDVAGRGRDAAGEGRAETCGAASCAVGAAGGHGGRAESARRAGQARLQSRPERLD